MECFADMRTWYGYRNQWLMLDLDILLIYCRLIQSLFDKLY